MRWSTVALLVPCAALAALGVRALAEDADRALTRLRAQAESAADSVALALQGEVAALAAGPPGSVVFRTRTDGVLVAPDWALDRRARPASRPAPDAVTAAPSEDSSSRTSTERDKDDAALLDYYDRDLLRAERVAGLDAAALRAREALNRPNSPAVAAALLTALGAIERRAGRLTEARAAWRRLAEEHPTVRDDHGVLRALAARLMTLESAPVAAVEAVKLYEDLLRDVPFAPENAYAYLTIRVAAAARTSLAAADADPATVDRFQALEREARARWRELNFRTLWREGAAMWAASGAADGVRNFAVDDRPSWILSLGPITGDLRDGGALEADLLAARALTRPEVAAVISIGLRPMVGGEPSDERDVLAGRALPAPWPEGWRLRVAGADLEGFRAAERRKFLLGLALAVGALLLAAAAGVTTIRAVDREVLAANDREMFVAATTHELKTPLAAIKLLAELTPDPQLPSDKRREFADRIGAEADRLARLVSAVLDFARLERASAAETRARFRPVDLGQTATEAANAFRPVAAHHGFAVRLETDERGPLIRGDAEALRGALLNLLDNAVKYAAAPHEILVRATVVDGRARLSVEDRGTGVAAADRLRIFLPFVRVGDELVRERPGAGLGLALVAKIAAAHGGSAAVAPREGGGSVFVMDLGPPDAGPPTAEIVVS